MKQTTSEFGKGFIYNLILFAKHWMMFEDTFKKVGGELEDYSMWFNAASDHFYDLEIPKKWKNTEIGKIAEWLREKSLDWGHGFEEKATRQDFDETFEKLEKLGLLIDKELGIDPIKAEWN